MTRIPPAHLANCAYCGDDIDTRGFGFFQFVSGWIEQRNKGGANAIALPKRKHSFACGICIDRLRHGVPPLQMSIFDAIDHDE